MKSGWRSNYTDFLFACYQMNLYSLYHEIENFSEEKIDHKSFTIMLYQQLMIQVEKLEEQIWIFNLYWKLEVSIVLVEII